MRPHPPGRTTGWAAALVVSTVAAGFSMRAAPDPSLPPVRGPAPRAISPLYDPATAGMQLDDPDRDRWQKPHQLVEALALRPGDTVADIGAGSGYLMPYLSRAVGPRGIVYAQEIQELFIPKLRARAEPLRNVRVVQGTAQDPRLPAQSVDCFVMLTVYHEVRQPVRFLRTLKLSGKPDARLAIIDFDARRPGHPSAPLGHEISTAAVIEEARLAGWTLKRRNELLGSQFYLVFQPTPERP